MTSTGKLPKISVITVVYNRVEAIGRTIENTLSQSYPNLEYIVIDGLSTDGTVEVIRAYSDRIRWISEPDNGIYDAMMKGVRMATGDWVIFRNAGDFFQSVHVIENVFREYEDKGEDLIIGGTRNFVNHYYKDDFSGYPEVDFFTSIPAHHTSTFIRRRTQLRYPYPAEYKQDSDIWFFMTVLKNGGTFYKTPYVVSLYDVRSGVTADHYDVTMKERIKTFRAFNAPAEKIERLQARLNHWLKVKKRNEKHFFRLFYKFTRWYYGYYQGGWHRYRKLEDIMN